MQNEFERERARLPIPEKFSIDMIGVRLEALAAGQSAMNGALGLMLDTLQVQTSLLRKLAALANETPAPSPVIKILDELTSAVMDLDASIGSLEKRFGELSGVIVDAFELESNQAHPPASNSRVE